MCPACLASATLFTTSVVSTVGVAAVAAKLFRYKKTSAQGSEVRDVEVRKVKENSK